MGNTEKSYPKTANNPLSQEPKGLFGVVDNTCYMTSGLAQRACRLRDVLIGPRPTAASSTASKPTAEGAMHEIRATCERANDDIEAGNAALQQIADYLGVGIPGVE